MKIIQLIIIVSIFSLTGCIKDDFNQTETPQGNSDVFSFLFETTAEKSFAIQFNDNSGSAMNQVTFEVYDQDPYLDQNGNTTSRINPEHMVFKGNSGQQGKVEFSLQLPLTVETIYVVPYMIGLQAVYPVEVGVAQTTAIIAPPRRDESYKSAHAGPVSKPSTKSISTIGFFTLGTWDNQGQPDYLDPEGDYISDDFLADINASLPEQQPLPQTHPQYLAEGIETNLVLEEMCEIWVTFVHEGAGWTNTLGYYTYPVDDPPESTDDLMDKTIIFPNASYLGSGGKLQSGDKVKLKYYDFETEMFTDTFPSNIVVGWFLIGGGWQHKYVTNGYITHYSNYNLNEEPDDENKKHNVLLYDEERELFLVGFEDMERDGTCDEDFNDAVFYATANPIEAVSTGNVQIIDDPEDTDGDGVSDVFDEYPEDPERAYNYYYPSTGSHASLAFEDLWPARGDYDFNDLVVDYQFQTVANAANNVVEIKPQFILRAIGAGFHNGFGFSIGIDPSDVSSVAGQQLNNNLINLNGNGTEANQSDAVIMVFDDAYDVLDFTAGGTFINTVPGDAYSNPQTINMLISFTEPLDLNYLGTAPYNPFIFVNGDRSVEVHLPGSAPTDLVDVTLFGTGQDESNPATGRYYFSSQDYPWAVNIPVSFQYPEEKVRITDAYLKFGDWASSNGYNYMDWYLENTGYRNDSKIYNNN
ncbi:MAG: LruC domain-containing protein [Bacteroidales bacterium]|nr:LruC domain-containing protein [Bacteroidales bacterium]